MPERRLQGLRGLRGLSDLSEAEQNKFLLDNAKVLSKYEGHPMRYGIAADRLYNNQKFINNFGIDAFNQYNDGTKASYDFRNQMTHNKLVVDAFKNTFGKDSNYNELVTFLDVDGMYDLLNNPDYLTTGELRKKYSTNLDAAKRVGKSYDKAIQNPYVDVIGQGFMQIGKQSSAQTPINILNRDKERNKEIFDKLKNESQKRREEAIQGDADMLYANMLMADDEGKQSLAKTLKEFDKIAKESNSYTTFKNSKWLNDYSQEDKLKDYSKYLALKSRYGEGVARQYLERNMQDRVAEAQDGRWTGNTLKGVLTTAWSDLGSNVALFSNAGSWFDTDRMAILNQGKDPDKPIYDKKGKIIDYKENTNIWTNPAYWNNVYKYNTFSPTEIKAIQERGGVSEDVNVRANGYTPDFFSWDTVEEGFKQGGHVIAGIVETGLTGGMGKAIGWGSKAALKGIGLSTKAMSTASKIGTATNDIFVGLTTGLEGAQLEAMGTFDDQMDSAREKINAEIERELTEYQQSINYNSKQTIAGINAIYNQLKAKDNRRVALNNREGSKAFPLSNETLKAQAKQLYTNQLLGTKQKELQELHKGDELEAAKVAAKAYGTNFIMDYIKNIPLTTAVQKYKIAKGSMRGAFDNTINKNILADAETGGVKRVTDKAGNAIKNASGKQLGKAMLKQLGGGFADEYMDGINASFAGGVGDNMFDNYIKKNYDPKVYDSTVDGFLGNMLAGLSEGIDGLTDRQNLYEGFIGMVSPVATATVNPNFVFSPKDAWKGVLKGTDVYGNKINLAEKVSKVLMNPLLSTYADAKEKDRTIDKTVEAINSVVTANKDKLDDAARIVSVLNNYDGPVTQNDFSVLDYKDNKLYNSFTLINALNSLENIEGGVNSKLYQDTMHTIKGLAEGNLSKEELDNEIDMALGDKNNKSMLEDKNAREEAANRLRKNAKYFMDMKDRMTDIQDTFARSQSLMKEDPRVLNILMYNLVATEDYKNRLKSIEDELGLGHTDAETMFTPDYSFRYGTEQAKQRGIAAREREIAKVQKEIGKLKDSNSYIEKKIKVFKRQEEVNPTGEKLEDKIKEQQTLLDSQKFRLKTLEEEKRKFNEEKEEISKVEVDGKDNGINTFSQESLLSSDIRDLAYVLDEDNISNFSVGRQEIIKSIKSALEKQDPEALRKIKDASILANRISDAKTSYAKILSNKELASNYLDAVGRVRERDAIAESVQREIKEHYDRIERAYLDREEAPDKFKDEILNTNSDLMEAYIEDHPQQEDAVRPYYELLKFDADADAVITNSTYSQEDKLKMLTTVLNLRAESDNRKELESKIESIIDSKDVDEKTKDMFDNLLSSLQKLGYQRDATILENRKQRKQREEDERKKKEDKQKKVEEESKKAADKKVEKQQEEDKVVSSKDDVDEFEGVDMGLDTTDESTEDNKTQSVEEEDLHQTDDGIINANSLMQDNFGNGSIDMGDMWYVTKDNPKKGKFYVSKEDDAITFWIDGIGNYKDTLNIEPNEYEVITDEQNKDKNTAFTAISLRKMDGDWYFNGNFAGDKEHTQVKVSKDFNIDKAIERQQTEREMEFAAQGVDVDNKNIIDNGDTVQGNSESIEEQMQDITSDNVEVHISDDNIDAAEQNGIGQLNIENGANTLLGGNAMSRYNPEVLEKDGVIVMKKGSSPTDHMNNYYAWMDAAGIKQQNIIDHELARIIQRNPHAKVKFLAVTPEVNATHDDHLKNDLFLVLDYDNNINKGITAIHNDSNGGVIESHGKKYLIIGTASYGNRNPDKQAVYNILFGKTKSQGIGLMVSGRVKYFNEHPDERFYVNDNLTTEIVPSSQIPGYIVRQTEKDSNPEFRSVKDLLADKERNPMGYNFNEVPWGIQELSQFLILKAPVDKVMVPRNPNRNSGSAFVLMPASNGKFVPSYLKVLKYNEMKDGALKDKINTILQNVVSPNYKTRLQAVIDLSNIFYFDKDGDFILLRKKKDELSLSHNGNILKTFVLDSNFDRGEFMQAFEQMNPRVNITARVLQSPDLLEEYNEAGALMTDAALFGTAGSSYSIYGLDREGNMLIPGTPKNDTPKVSNNSDFKKDSRSQIIFKHDYYTYDSVGDSFSINGKPITNESEIMQLRYNKRIIDNALTPVISKGIFDSYILSTGEHPTAIKVNRNTKEVKELTEKQTKELISQIEEEKAKKAREEAAQNESKANKAELTEVSEEMGFDEDNTGMIIDPNTGEAVQTDLLKTEPTEETSKESAPMEKNTINGENTQYSTKNIRSTKPKGETKSLTELFKDADNRRKINSAVKSKWSNAPRKISELMNFLRDKNIEVDNIGTSKNDIEAWIKTMEDCR